MLLLLLWLLLSDSLRRRGRAAVVRTGPGTRTSTDAVFRAARGRIRSAVRPRALSARRRRRPGGRCQPRRSRSQRRGRYRARDSARAVARQVLRRRSATAAARRRRTSGALARPPRRRANVRRAPSGWCVGLHRRFVVEIRVCAAIGAARQHRNEQRASGRRPRAGSACTYRLAAQDS